MVQCILQNFINNLFFKDAQETPNYKRILFYFLKLKSH